MAQGDINSIVANMRACLISRKEPSTFATLTRDYTEIIGSYIPYTRFGYKSLEEFIKDEPTLKTYIQDGTTFVSVVPKPESNHISEMIAKQKPSKKRPISTRLLRMPYSIPPHKNPFFRNIPPNNIQRTNRYRSNILRPPVQTYPSTRVNTKPYNYNTIHQYLLGPEPIKRPIHIQDSSLNLQHCNIRKSEPRRAAFTAKEDVFPERRYNNDTLIKANDQVYIKKPSNPLARIENIPRSNFDQPKLKETVDSYQFRNYDLNGNKRISQYENDLNGNNYKPAGSDMLAKTSTSVSNRTISRSLEITVPNEGYKQNSNEFNSTKSSISSKMVSENLKDTVTNEGNKHDFNFKSMSMSTDALANSKATSLSDRQVSKSSEVTVGNKEVEPNLLDFNKTKSMSTDLIPKTSSFSKYLEASLRDEVNEETLRKFNRTISGYNRENTNISQQSRLLKYKLQESTHLPSTLPPFGNTNKINVDKSKEITKISPQSRLLKYRQQHNVTSSDIKPFKHTSICLGAENRENINSPQSNTSHEQRNENPLIVHPEVKLIKNTPTTFTDTDLTNFSSQEKLPVLDAHVEPFKNEVNKCQPKSNYVFGSSTAVGGSAFNNCSKQNTTEQAAMEKDLATNTNEVTAENHLPVTDSNLVGGRLLILTGPEKGGVLLNDIPKTYRDHYKENLPANWVELAKSTEMFLIENSTSGLRIFNLGDLPGSNVPTLNKATLNNATLNNATLNKATLNNATLNEATLNEATLNNATLNEATLNEATLNKATLNEVTLNEATLNEATLNKATLNKDMDYTEISELVYPRDEYWSVYITHISSTISIWCRIIGSQYNSRYEDINNLMEEESHEKKSVASKITVGSYYVVNYLNSWQRIQIVQEFEKQVLCFYIDLGCEELNNKSDIYILESNFRSVPPQAIRLRLMGLETLGECKIGISHLSNLLLNKSLVAQMDLNYQFDLHNKENSKDLAIPVILYDTYTAEDINLNNELSLKIKNEMLPKLNDTKMTDQAFVSHVNSAGNVFLQLRNEVFTELQKQIQYATNIGFTKEDFSKSEQIVKEGTGGKTFLITHPGRKSYRVQLDGPVSNGRVSVYFLDSGIRRIVDVDKLIAFEIVSMKIFDFPPQVMIVQLYGLDNFSPNLAKRFKEFVPVTKPVFVKLKENSEIPKVELFINTEDRFIISVNNVMQNDISREIAQFDTVTESVQKEESGPACKSSKPAVLKTLPELNISLDNKHVPVFITLATSPSNFIIQPAGANSDFENLMDKLQNECESGESEMPPFGGIEEGEIYAAKHNDGIWYRAQIHNLIRDNLAIVYFCDYGDFDIICAQNLRYLSPDFLQMPANILKAQLHGSNFMGEWSVSHCLSFNKLVSEAVFGSYINGVQPCKINPKKKVVSLTLTLKTKTNEVVHINARNLEEVLSSLDSV